MIIGDYFSTIFSLFGPNIGQIKLITDAIMCNVSKEANEQILKPFIGEEIKKALAGMHPTKAPSVDEILALFYQKYWSVVGAEVTDVFMCVFNDGEPVDLINKMVILLILKIKSLSGFLKT